MLQEEDLQSHLFGQLFYFHPCPLLLLAERATLKSFEWEEFKVLIKHSCGKDRGDDRLFELKVQC